MAIDFRTVRAVLFDLDGTLTVDGRPLPGAAATLQLLRERGIPFRICSNTTTRSQRSMAQMLTAAGLPVDPDQVFSAPGAAREYLRRRKARTCWLLLAEDTLTDFSEFNHDSDDPELIVIGDIGERWDYALMNRLFQLVRNGAEIVALHRGKSWLTGGQVKLDIGAFVSGLEYATGKPAIVIGKPSRDFYLMALSSLKLPASEVIMVGDDLDNDVAGAQAVGLKAVLVTSGKSDSAPALIQPDLTLKSVAELKALFT